MITREKSLEFYKKFNDDFNNFERKTSRHLRKEGLKKIFLNDEIATEFSKSHIVNNMHRNNGFAIIKKRITYAVSTINPSTNKREVVSYLEKESLDEDWKPLDGSLIDIPIDLIKDNPKEILVCDRVSETLTAQLIFGREFSIIGIQFKDTNTNIPTTLAEKIKKAEKIIFLSNNEKLLTNIKLINPNIELVNYKYFTNAPSISTLIELVSDIADKSKRGENLIEKVKNLLIDNLNLTVEKSLKFEYISIAKLKPHPKNDRVLPPLSDEEFNGLKLIIKKLGFTEAIEAMKNSDGSYTILDGHHRVKIAKELGIEEVPYKIIETDDPEGYIVDKNLNRRQVEPKIQSLVRAKEYEKNKKDIGTNQHSGLSTESNPKSTRKIVSENFGVSESTIARDVEFKKNVDKIEDEKLKQELLSDKNTSKSDIEKISKVEPEKQKEFAQELKASKSTKSKKDEDKSAISEDEFDEVLEDTLKVVFDKSSFFQAVKDNNSSMIELTKEPVKLIFGDKASAISNLKDKSIDLVLLDSLNEDDLTLIKPLSKKLFPTGKILIFSKPSFQSKVYAYLEKKLSGGIEFRSSVIWSFKNPENNILDFNTIFILYGKKANVDNYNFIQFEEDELKVGDINCELEKPVELLKFLLQKESNENQTILDLSPSNGNILNASKEFDRKFILIENNIELLESITNRL